MNHTKILYCTLRDGAYLLDKRFGDDVIRGVIDGLMKAKIDIIEIGFFQNEGFGKGKTVYRNLAHAKDFIPDDKHGIEFTVLADHSRFSVDNLEYCDKNSIDGVRECFFKKERSDAIQSCKTIKEKGYKCFVQPVDILGYTDIELIEFLDMVNEIEPYCFSIVDTFGSMYQEDLQRIFEMIDHNLISTCMVGFHSHNNMQMSSALSQEFIRMAMGKRKVIVDSTISGMGRGAGNTPTELVAQYMVQKLGYNYNIDALLDVIDTYMDNLRSKCTWGYSTSYFIAGSYGAHVNNITYLMKKNSIRSRDIRYILNKIGKEKRKRYDYELLEETYMDYMTGDVDDEKGILGLKERFLDRNVLILVPGHSVIEEIDLIKKYIIKEDPVIIGINFVHKCIYEDYIYISNQKRYHNLMKDQDFKKMKKIIASNIKQEAIENEIIVSFTRLIKCGWEHLDNSTLMLLRLLDCLNINSIGIAGFDGYDYKEGNDLNYADTDLELANVRENPKILNEEISSMLRDLKQTRKKDVPIRFVTSSRFEKDLVDND